MRVTLTDYECRVVGVLLEKSMTSPENYPLSLNALTNGVNQKSNRAPVYSLTESEVQDVVNDLLDKRLLQVMTGFGSRVDKYAHRFCNTEFSDLKLSDHQVALLAELFLRGAQTPGELRGRCQRMASFSDVGEVESALATLQAYQPYALVCRLPKEPGKREVRFRHCLGEEPIPEPALAATSSASSYAPSTDARLLALEQEVATLKEQLAQLKETISATIE